MTSDRDRDRGELSSTFAASICHHLSPPFVAICCHLSPFVAMINLSPSVAICRHLSRSLKYFGARSHSCDVINISHCLKISKRPKGVILSGVPGVSTAAAARGCSKRDTEIIVLSSFRLVKQTERKTFFELFKTFLELFALCLFGLVFFFVHHVGSCG